MKCKRLLCFGMAAALAFSSLPGITAFARESHTWEQQKQEAMAAGVFYDWKKDEDTGNPFFRTTEDGCYEYYELTNGTLEIMDYDYMGKETEIVVPSVIDGKKVTQIAADCFATEEELQSVVIPDGVTYIGATSFRVCTNLSSVTIPSSVVVWGYQTFIGCSSLKDIYYGGSQKQWEQLWEKGYLMNEGKYKDWNDYLAIGESVTVHFNPNAKDPEDSDEKPEDPDKKPETTDPVQTPEQPGDTPQTPQQPETPQKSDQTITAKDITKTYGDKPFSLNATAETALSYASKDTKVATVDQNGKVTIKGCGITNITITAKDTDDYNQATKTVKLTVKPKKATLSSVKSTKKQTAKVTWKKDTKASGYIIQLATDSKFKNNKVQVTVSKNKTVSSTVKKLKAGKKYYVRVCAYAKSGKTKVQGNWSKAKTVKVKK